MSRVKLLRWAFAVGLTLLVALAGPAFAQLQTGNLYGRVVGADGGALPGVTVTLSGEGAPQVQVTDESGRFRFPSLYPGTYKLSAELQGFSTLEYPDVGVRVGANTEIEMTLSGAVEDVITVTGESPLLDQRKTNQGASVAADELDKVPTARDPWSLLSMAPGVLVDRFNVGGNESGQQSSFLGVGSGSRDNTYAVDGVILTDMNSVGDSATYFDFGAFEEVQLTVSSSDVSIATSGVTINQVTKRGTNTWRAQGRYLRTDGDLQSEPAIPGGNQIESVEEYGADVGGPLWKDHLWLWAAYGESDIQNRVQGGQLDRTKLEDLNTKLNFQAGAKNSGVLHYWTNDKLKFGRGAGPTRAPGTTHNQTTPQDIYKIEDTFIPTANFYLTGLWARDDGFFTLSPLAGLDVDMYRDADGVLQGSNFDFAQHAIIDQGRLEASYFFNAGGTNNELRFGGGFREQENESGTVWPRGKSVVSGELLGLDPGQAMVIFPRNRTVAVTSSYDSAWIQDTLTRDRWTINAGLRYDLQTLENGAVADAGNPIAGGLLPPISFPGNDAGGFEWESIVPRVGVTYSLGAERKSLIRGTFSQYAEQLGQNPLASRVNPIGYSYAYFYFTDANGNLVFDPSEAGSLEFAYTYNIDPDAPSSLFTPNVNDRNLDPMMTDEITLGFEHGLRADLAVGVNLTYRNIHDIPETRWLITDETGNTRLATRDDWVQTGTTSGKLPNGQTSGTVPVFDLRDGLEWSGGRLYTNGDREQDYLGVTLSANKRLANRWMMRSHVTWNDWKWKIGPEYRKYEDPTDVVADDLGYSDGNDPYYEQSGGTKGSVFVGSKWSFNVSGLYQVAPDRPWGFNVGASVDGREGYITPPFIRRGGSVGRRNVQLAPIDEFRNDDVIVANAHFDKDFRLGETVFNLGLDGFNLLNEDYVLQVERDVNAGRAGQTNETLSPRVFRMGVTVRFR